MIRIKNNLKVFAYIIFTILNVIKVLMNTNRNKGSKMVS